MIRVWLSNSQRAYGFDVTGWEDKNQSLVGMIIY